VVGFERTIYMVNEPDGQVELCVNVTVPENQNINGVTFNLAVETQDGTASMSNTMNKLCERVIILAVYQVMVGNMHIHTILCWL